MKRTKVAVVGMGLIGRAQLEALRRIPQVEVTALCGHSPEATRALAEIHGVPYWTCDIRRLLQEAEVDAIHNCTPNALHDEINRLAIAAGKHIYGEKPLSLTAADALETWRLAEAAGVVHGLNHQYRMNAAVQEMRARIARGEMGRVFLLSGRYHQQSGLYATDGNWRMTDGGASWALADIGTHWVDTARCVTGLRIERVFADMRTVHPVRTAADGSPVEIAKDDLSAVLLAFEGGAQGVLSVSKVSAGRMNDLVLRVEGQACGMGWAQENPNHLSIGYKGQPNADLQVMPTLMSPEAADLATLPGGHPLGWHDALTAAIREFYRAVRGEIAQSAMRCATFADGYEGMLFVEAALQSSRTGRWADLRRG